MSLNRRQFIQLSAFTGAGLVIGTALPGCQPIPYPHSKPGLFQPNAFLQISEDNEIVFQLHKAEMGQGVVTGMTTLVAEELEVDPAKIKIEFAPVHPDFGDPDYGVMLTGGSSSVANNFDLVRQLGATVREMFLIAAAQRWGVVSSQCYAEEGWVTSPEANQRASYGDLVAQASTLAVPTDVRLKPAENWKLIGHYNRRLDATAKATGTAEFGIDVQVPAAVDAVLVRCPHFGGHLRSFDATATLAVEGVLEAIATDFGVAVVAESYWQARQGANKLQIEWTRGPNAGMSSASILAEHRRLLDEEEGESIRDDMVGDPPDSIVLESEYSVPYLAHATMEPMNAVAKVQQDRCDIWAGNQAPDFFQAQVAALLDMEPSQVTVHNVYLGGSFGRRAMADVALEAATIAKITGRVIKLTWSREDDMAHDYYRGAFTSRLSAQINKQGNKVFWQHKIVGPSVMKGFIPEVLKMKLPGWTPEKLLQFAANYFVKTDPTSSEGAKELPYDFDGIKVDFVFWDPGVPIGFWRSVGHSQNAFSTESFVDEVASAMGEDALGFRLQSLSHHPRLNAVLEQLKEVSGWGNPLQSGHFQGVALHEAFGTVVGEVAEVSVERGNIKVHRVSCVVDCGVVVNPDIVRMQMESSIVYGLTAALKGNITIKDGAVEQSNFHDYPALRMNECPDIDVHIVSSNEPPSGAGEPGLPPIAPAVANAVFAATGQRLRALPLKLQT